MGGDDVPAVRKAHPGLHLPPDLARRGVAMKQRGGSGEVAPIGGDRRARNRPRQADGRARRTERADFVPAIQDLAMP